MLRKQNKAVTLIEILIAIAILATLVGGATGLYGLFGGNLHNNWNDWWRDIKGTQKYKITLYGSDGKPCFTDTLSTYINVKDNGSGVRYYKDNKLVMFNGTYTVEEQ